MNGAVATMKRENEQNLTATIEAVRVVEKKQFLKEMEEMKQHIEKDRVHAVAEAEQNVASIQEQLKMLKDVSLFMPACR